MVLLYICVQLVLGSRHCKGWDPNGTSHPHVISQDRILRTYTKWISKTRVTLFLDKSHLQLLTLESLKRPFFTHHNSHHARHTIRGNRKARPRRHHRRNRQATLFQDRVHGVRTSSPQSAGKEGRACPVPVSQGDSGSSDSTGLHCSGGGYEGREAEERAGAEQIK